MFSFLSEILKNNLIEYCAPIPLRDCRIIRPYLLERAQILDGTVFMLAVPYFTKHCLDSERNVSAYAVSRDYHLYFRELFHEILSLLRKKFPQHRFAAFADHSPIAEVEAAARSGIGIIGNNHMLITPKYSSYVFLGEIITDADVPCQTREILSCIKCGTCQKACPTSFCGGCLSNISQKKGALCAEDRTLLIQSSSVWGCDRCQEVCPYTKKAIESGTIFSPISFFVNASLSHLTSDIIDQMDEFSFSERAYSWRGKDTIRRNLKLLENTEQKGDFSC